MEFSVQHADGCGVAALYCRAQEDAGEEAAEPVVERMLKDEIIRLTNLKASAKIRSVWSQGKTQNYALSAAVSHNLCMNFLTLHAHLLHPPSDGWTACHVRAVS